MLISNADVKKTGMVKRTLKDVNCFSINSINDIEKLKNEFRK